MVLGVAMLVIAAAPQFALASWWNPFSWHLFQKYEAPTQQVIQIPNVATTTDVQSGSSTISVATIASSTSVMSTTTNEVPSLKKAAKPQIPKPRSHVTPVVQTIQTNSSSEAPSSSNSDNTNKEISSKARSLEIIDQIISTESQINDSTTQQISLLNSNLNAIIGKYDTASVTFRSLTTIRRDRLQSALTAIQQSINFDHSRKAQLESADMSTYLDFNPDSFFKGDLDRLVQIKAQSDADNNSYQDAMRSYSGIMSSLVTPAVQTTSSAPQSTATNCQINSGYNGGMTSYVSCQSSPAGSSQSTTDPAICAEIKAEPIAYSYMVPLLQAHGCSF